MKIILLNLLLMLSAMTSLAQNLTSEEYSHLNHYVSLPPTERVSFFQAEMYTSITTRNFFIMSSDISGISGVDVLKSGSVSIAGVIGGIFITNDSAFKILIDSTQKIVANKCCYKTNQSKKLSQSDSTDYRIIKRYLSNSPKERIAFVEKNFNTIPQQLFPLIKLDLDRIFNVETNSFAGNKKLFLKAKKTWLSSVKR